MKYIKIKASMLKTKLNKKIIKNSKTSESDVFKMITIYNSKSYYKDTIYNPFYHKLLFINSFKRLCRNYIYNLYNMYVDLENSYKTKKAISDYIDCIQLKIKKYQSFYNF